MMDAQIEQLKQRDNKAFEDLYHLVAPQIRFFCERIVGNNHEAEDIFMQSFAKYCERSVNFNSLDDIKAFLYVTAKNFCFKYLEKQKVKEKYKRSIVAPFADDEQLRLEYYAYESILLEELYKEVEKLPTQCKEAFKLCYFERLPRDKVAEKMNISLATVHRHCSIAIQKLRLIFGQKELLMFLAILQIYEF